MVAAIDALRTLYADAENADYIGESVTQLAHALQAAELARSARASDDEVLAALLHDVGHLCAPGGAPRMGGHGVAGHEHVGAEHLVAVGFGAAVAERVRGHVAAKRYLVSARPEYAERLSVASVETLRHQGGPMDASERAAFEASPLCDSWLRLRSWDETAKVAGLEVPDFESYAPLLEAHLRQEDR